MPAYTTHNSTCSVLQAVAIQAKALHPERIQNSQGFKNHDCRCHCLDDDIQRTWKLHHSIAGMVREAYGEKYFGSRAHIPFLQYASRIIVAMGQRRSNHAVILWQRVELSSELARLVKVTFMQNSQEGRVGMVPIFCN